MAATIAGLTPANYEKYRQAIFKSEAGRQGYLTPPNSIGFLGGYGFGAQALETVGYLKKGSYAAAVSPSDPYGNSAMQNPANWTGVGGVRSVQDFLKDSRSQDEAFKRLTIGNARTLSTLKPKGYSSPLLTDDTSQEVRAGYLGASHLAGAGGVISDPSMSRQDLNGTKARDYYNRMSAAVSGSTTTPPENPASASGSGGGSTTTPPSAGSSGAAQENPVDRGGAISDGSVSGFATSVTLDSGSNGGDDEKISLPIPNPLHEFVSFNSLFTLSSLSADGINYPENGYRKGIVGNIILSTGGRFANSRVSTAYKTYDNPSGKYDYFVDNVEIFSQIATLANTKGTNVVQLNFDVIEPYSMGQFLQSCQIAAANNKHQDYSQAPYLFTIEFQGYTETGESRSVATKYFPIRLVSINMSVTGAGCRYKVIAQAWNDVAMNDNYNILKSDFAISGATVVEMLQSGDASLERSVNFRLLELSKQDKAKEPYIPDEIAIIFPDVVKELNQAPKDNSEEDKGSTSEVKQGTAGGGSISTKVNLTRNKSNIFVQNEADVSPLGKAKFNFTQAQGGLDPKKEDAPKDATPLSNKAFPRNVYKVDPTKREFIFKKGTSIINAITEVMLMSEYCTDTIKGKPDAKGFYNWFRIESQCYLTTPNKQNINVGIHPKLLVYRVIPYKVHQSLFVLPNTTSKGYKELEAEAVKRYDYIYTGKNLDVLDFKLDMNNNYATPILSHGIGAAAGEALMSRLGQSGAGQDSIRPYIQTIGGPGSQGGGDTATGIALGVSKTDRPKNSDGAGDADSYATLVARQFQSRIWYSDTEKAIADLVIMGDPYYLADSGIGNFTNTNSTSRLNLTATNSMDYQSGEVDIIFNFRTPIDLNSSGTLSFDQDVKDQLEIPFSGLFKVVIVKSNFVKGKFTQTLSLMRRPNQNPPGLEALSSAVPAQDSLSEGEEIVSSSGQSGSDQRDSAAVNPSLEETKTAIYTNNFEDGEDVAWSSNPNSGEDDTYFA